jgi:hypothetical protein
MTVKAQILNALDRCNGLLMPEPTLLNDIRLLTVPAPTATEFYSALRELEAARLVVSVRSELMGAIKWRLTDAGKAALLSEL